MEFIRRDQPDDPVCESGIFCYGPLLEAVQMSRLFKDSKTFVDKKLKFPPGKIIKDFENLLSELKYQPNEQQIKEFVDAHFDDEGLELEKWSPPDTNMNPPFIQKLKNSALRGLAKRVGRLWQTLSRKIKDDVKENGHLYSIIYVPNGFIVPGGRFREFYYWDTYWIAKALLHYEMFTTVRGIIENFMYMVETYGMVPNGGRIYYIKRSQPPVMTIMARDYFEKTNDVEFLRKNIGTMEKEVYFWETRRSVEVKCKDGALHKMFLYGTGGTGPRPESYREDVETAEELATEIEKQNFYYNIKAGAESGWDYSSRWMIDDMGGNDGGLKQVNLKDLIPVDLNAFMFQVYTSISNFHGVLGNSEKSEEFKKKAEDLREAITQVLFDERQGCWFDHDMLNNAPRRYFYPSNLCPLWAGCLPKNVTPERAGEKAVQYLEKHCVLDFKGGVPTSMCKSGQQWDFPNAWPPLQHMLVVGLLKCGGPKASKVAQTIARRYTNGTMFSCPADAEVCHMFEKYDVTGEGSAGGGGEYDVQDGFGWTNGVVIDFIEIFGDDLLKEDPEEETGKLRNELVSAFDATSDKSHPVKV